MNCREASSISQWVIALALVSSVGAFACSSDSTSNTGNNATDGGSEAAVDAGSDAAGPLNGCTSFVDQTVAAELRTITWDFSVASSPSRCMKIKVGQTVTWKGSQATHPLGEKGGNSPNPIASPSVVGDEAKVTFTAAGLFGFVCTAHPSMNGAILVEP